MVGRTAIHAQTVYDATFPLLGRDTETTKLHWLRFGSSRHGGGDRRNSRLGGGVHPSDAPVEIKPLLNADGKFDERVKTGG